MTIDRETNSRSLSWLAWTESIGSRHLHVLPTRIPGKTCPGVSIRWIVAHEIGHSFGIQHVQSRSLMSETCDSMTTCVDSLSLDWAAHHQGLDRSRISPGCSPQ